MKRTNIYLDEEQARQLRHLAIDEGRSFTDLVREALTTYLAQRALLMTSSRVIAPRRSVPPDEWRSRLTEALERIRTDPPDHLEADEIESEITIARDEVRHERAARRQTGRA